jgi:hypothetical protein
MNADRQCWGVGCFGDMWAWESGWKILQMKIFIILVPPTYKASLNELALYVGEDIHYTTTFKSVHMNRKYNFVDTASDAGLISKSSYESRVRDGESIDVPVIWPSGAL